LGTPLGRLPTAGSAANLIAESLPADHVHVTGNTIIDALVWGIHLCEPLGYLDFIHVLESSDLVLTDFGGVQEEAPALAKPVLVLRDMIERPEAVEAGAARVVGPTPASCIRR